MESSSKGRFTTLIALAAAGCLTVAFAAHPQPSHGMTKKGSAVKTHIAAKSQRHSKSASARLASQQNLAQAPIQMPENNWLGGLNYGDVHAAENDTTATNTCQAFKIVVNSW